MIKKEKFNKKRNKNLKNYSIVLTSLQKMKEFTQYLFNFKFFIHYIKKPRNRFPDHRFYPVTGKTKKKSGHIRYTNIGFKNPIVNFLTNRFGICPDFIQPDLTLNPHSTKGLIYQPQLIFF